jgi:glycosyltransferase involved in cell wall biosynthesis
MMRADVKLLSYRLLAAALREADDLNWQLLIVGDGEARDEVAALMASFSDRVRLVGGLSPTALPEIYAAADLYVWPSCNEAYGMALLEAQAAGVPVVAGAEGGVPDIVVDGETGLLTAPRQPAAFAAAVRSLLTDPARRRAMGRAAQAEVLARHDAATARERLADALQAIGVPPCVSA